MGVSFTESVGSSLDDNEYSGSTYYTNSAAPTLSVSSYTLVGARFTTINIPRGSTIINATVEVYAADSKNLAMDGDIQAHAHDDAPDGNTQINTRTKTTASVIWTAALTNAVYNTSPNIKTVIQEIVNRSGWAANNALMIIFTGRTSSTCGIAQWDKTPTGTYSMKLNITYKGPLALNNYHQVHCAESGMWVQGGIIR